MDKSATEQMTKSSFVQTNSTTHDFVDTVLDKFMMVELHRGLANPDPTSMSTPWTVPQDLHVHILLALLQRYDEEQLRADPKVDSEKYEHLTKRVLNHVCNTLKPALSNKDRNWSSSEKNVSPSLLKVIKSLQCGIMVDSIQDLDYFAKRLDAIEKQMPRT